MHLGRAASALVLAACVGGCAGSRPGVGPPLGYEESRLDSTSYVISFRGDARSSHESVRRAVLTRCAELTRGSGHDYFILLAIGTTGVQDEVQMPDQVTSGRARSTPRASAITTATPMGEAVRTESEVPGEQIRVTRYKTTVTMRMCSGARPPNNPNAHAVGEFLGASRRD
jgi:hypothetical protein